MHASNWVALVQTLVWPAFALAVALIFRHSLLKLLSAVEKRLDSGAEVTSTWITFGAVPSNLQSPDKNSPVTENHLALVHSNWRYPKKDAEFSRPMFGFHIIIQATDDVLDRIEFVKYGLHPSYPNPLQTVTDRKSRFKLKELAWGESTVRAGVKIKGQDEPINLSRYINLNRTGPRI